MVNMDFCTDYNFLNGLLIIKFFYQAALIIFPIVIILVGTYDGIKAVTTGTTEDIKGIATKVAARLTSLLLIFLLPTILHTVFNMIDGYDGINNKLTICMNNADSNVIAGLKRAREKELRGMQKSTQTYLASYNKSKYVKRTTSNGANQVSGKGNFVKYELTDSQLVNLASMCYREQGSAEGAAAEASIMANLFELKGGGYGTGASGLYNYVHNGGWFAGKSMNGTISDPEVISAVRAVLVDGKRTLPGYIDEHDCIYCGANYGYDITSASNNGQSFDVNDKSQYQQHVTVLKNRYGSTYTFYSFPTPTSDPFGYTSEENRERIGDDCYSYDQIMGS